ncbi:MAG TPA: class II glutamine amidotransferase [Polyangiales bacterium]|nr:class II glutamine amidotransferase [Polyangiales bacterium]
MCELLGVVSNMPADLVFSFTGFAMRGGQTGPHADGWGLSLYDGLFARTFLEPHPAFSSPLARFLRENPIQTGLAIAHIRKKTRGEPAIVNTHPFVRVFDARHLVFAHNGTLPNIRNRKLRWQSTLGDTDSEHAFCVLIEELREAYGETYPSDPHELGKTLHELGNELGADGVFNFLYADGEHLYARCGDSLSFIERKPPFGSATLVDADVRVNLGEIMREVPDARMSVIATEPLTRDERWEKGKPGELWVFRAGERVLSFPGSASAQAIADAWANGQHRAQRPSSPPAAASASQQH